MIVVGQKLVKKIVTKNEATTILIINKSAYIKTLPFETRFTLFLYRVYIMKYNIAQCRISSAMKIVWQNFVQTKQQPVNKIPGQLLGGDPSFYMSNYRNKLFPQIKI